MFKPVLLACLLSSTVAFADGAGVREVKIAAPHHGRDMSVAVFFPTDRGGETQVFGENPVFFGTELAAEGAMPVAQDGGAPVIVLSHGLGGHYRTLSWFAAGLAERGAVVVAVNHPESTWGDFDMQKGLRHWTRVQDVGVALDWLMADSTLAPMVDPDRVHAVGFSYGGWTALSLIGLRGDLGEYIAHCNAFGAQSSHCADIAEAGADLSALEPGLWGADHADPRIRSAVAIDPGLIYGLPATAADGLRGEVLLIGLGEGASRLAATDFSADGAHLVGLMPEAKVVEIAPAMHFSMLPICKPMAEAILAEERDDPVCTEPEGTDRAAVHARVLDETAAFLGLGLSAQD